METIAQRLIRLREAAKLTQQQLATAAGISQGTIGNLESGLRRYGKSVVKIASALGTTPAYLQLESEEAAAGRQDALERKVMPEIPAGALFVDPSKYKRIWVVGKGAGGLPERIWTDGDHPVGVTDAYGEVASTDPYAFLTEVEGASMYPKYTPHDYALVEPSTEPELEDDVLVRLQSGETMIKRLLSRRDGYRFGSYNDPTIYDFPFSEVSWIYYIAHPVPRRKIKSRN